MVINKNIVFFIGNTGSGKSTNILKLLGNKLKKGKYKDLSTLIPAHKLPKEHQTFYSSP